MNCGIKRILQFNDLVSAGPIQVFNQEDTDITNNCSYSWSSDSVCWTNWVDYTNYSRLSKNIEEDVYIRILLDDSLSKVSLNNLFTKCYSVCIADVNPFEIDFCGNENLYSPYTGLDCALQLQQQLADSIVCMFGIPIFYFRVTPDKETVDYTFKEYVLHNVIDIKQLKLMIPDGTMPSSNPKFTALDFDWQVDWDVELGKTAFTTAFGEGVVPKARDFIYIPMMKRMWKINTAYDEKNENLMWQSTTWKLSLIKYEDSDNISIPDSIDGIIDNWITRYDSSLGDREKQEQERLSGSPQLDAPHPTSTNLYSVALSDAVRKYYTKNEVTVSTQQYNHRSNVVARNTYTFKKPTSTIIYQKEYCGDSGTLSFILTTYNQHVENQNIISIGPVQISINYVQKESKKDIDKYEICCGDVRDYIKTNTTYLIILRWNRGNYTVSMNGYEYKSIPNTPKYLLKPEMYYFDENPTFSKTIEYNDDYNINKGQHCSISSYPCSITNIKLYNKDLGLDESIKESFKYTTTHKNCLINDVARPLNTDHGYAVH